MIKTVYLDMDGVLVDFRRGICEALNKPIYPASQKWYFWEEWPDITFEMVNNACSIDFWRNLDWMPDGKEILSIIFNKFNINQIYILTTPMPNPNSPTGKWLWIKDNLPEFYKRTIITQAPKKLLANSDTLLIDDKDQNIDEFVNAGGRGILVPRSWNDYNVWADRSLEFIKICLESF